MSLAEPKQLKGGFVTHDVRLDRVPQQDPRSANYPIRTLLEAKDQTSLRSYTWGISVTLDQGREGACVGNGFSHEAAAKPVEVKSITEAVALDIYHRAQQLDDWPGEAYSGTSVLAGAKAAAEKGWLTEYRWATTLEDVVLAIGHHGPVVFGFNWYEGMFQPDDKGWIHVSGNLSGGHCLLGRGVKVVFKEGTTDKTFASLDLDKSYITLHNSWGPDWGDNGDCKISLRDVQRLLLEQGDCCVPVHRGMGH